MEYKVLAAKKDALIELRAGETLARKQRKPGRERAPAAAHNEGSILIKPAGTRSIFNQREEESGSGAMEYRCLRGFPRIEGVRTRSERVVVATGFDLRGSRDGYLVMMFFRNRADCEEGSCDRFN